MSYCSDTLNEILREAFAWGAVREAIMEEREGKCVCWSSETRSDSGARSVVKRIRGDARYYCCSQRVLDTESD